MKELAGMQAYYLEAREKMANIYLLHRKDKKMYAQCYRYGNLTYIALVHVRVVLQLACCSCLLCKKWCDFWTRYCGTVYHFSTSFVILLIIKGFYDLLGISVEGAIRCAQY